MGDLQWVRSIMRTTNDDLAPLMPLLGHSTDAGEKRVLNSEQKRALQSISLKISQQTAAQRIAELPLLLAVINTSENRKHMCGLII